MEKKDFNSFIISDYYDDGKELISRYNEISDLKRKTVEELKKYNEMAEEVTSNKLDFADILSLYKLVSRIKNYNKMFGARLQNTGILDGINLDELEEKLYLKTNHRELKADLRDYSSSIEYIAEYEISFSCIGDSFCHHKFVDIDGSLRCVLCNGTTKEFDLTKEEYNFLVSIAKVSGRYLGEIKESDIPLLEVLQQEWEDYFKYYETPYDELIPEEQEDYYEEMVLANEWVPHSIINNINFSIDTIFLF